MDIEGSTALEHALIENLHRDGLNPLEEAAAYQQLIEDFELTHDDVAGRVGKSRTSITNPNDINAVAASCRDVNLLVNNAGISTATAVLAADALEKGRQEFETNVFGPLAMSRVCAGPAANGGERSSTSCPCWRGSASPKRRSTARRRPPGGPSPLAAPRTARPEHHVLALHVGLMDTDMTAGLEIPKASPIDVAAQTLDGIEAGAFEVLADDASRHVRAALSKELPAMYPALG
jgi:hypothetical protein